MYWLHVGDTEDKFSIDLIVSVNEVLLALFIVLALRVPLYVFNKKVST